MISNPKDFHTFALERKKNSDGGGGLITPDKAVKNGDKLG